MAEDVSDLVVRMRPDGVDETRQGLQSAEEATQQTTEALEEQSEQAEGFLQQFEGAMGAAVAGLAVASAGLLSQVPVIGQAMEGLFSIVEAVAFQMDQVLRPVLGPISNGFFNLSGAVFNLNGPLGSLVGILGTLTAAFAGLAVIGKITGLFSAFSVVSSGLSTILPVVAGALTTVAGVLGLPVAAVAALTAGFVGLVAVLATDFLGIRTKLINFITTIGSALFSAAGNVAQAAAQISQSIISALLGLPGQALDLGESVVNNVVVGLGNGLNAITTAVGNVVDRVADPLIGLAGDAFSWGANIIEGFIDGIQSLVGKVKNAAGNIANAVKDRLQGNSPPPMGPLSDFDQAGPALVDTLTNGLTANVGQVRTAANNVAESATPDSDGQTANITNGDRQSIIEVDGRVLGETTSKKQRSVTAARNIDG